MVMAVCSTLICAPLDSLSSLSTVPANKDSFLILHLEYQSRLHQLQIFEDIDVAYISILF